MNVRKGYSPEATTLCRLWLDNDEREYKFTQAVIAEAVRNREDREERIIMLAGRLEDFMKVNAPDLGANVWGDLLESAIESVDFYTLAALKGAQINPSQTKIRIFKTKLEYNQLERFGTYFKRAEII